MSTDIAVGTVGLPAAGSTLKKPNYLLRLLDGKKQVNFLSVDRPQFENGFVLVKGYFVEGDDLTVTPEKDAIVEMYFPNQNIVNIKNLAYKPK